MSYYRFQQAPVSTALFIIAITTASYKPSLSQGEEPSPTTDSSHESIVEVSIADLQAAMSSGTLTSKQIVQAYLNRIERHEKTLNAVMSINPNALAEAERLDEDRAKGQVRGPLHGIPIALKDNIHTTSMPTTAGTLAFAHLVPPYEATLTKNLHKAGAIIIAKTTMTELANWMSTGMPDNYSALAGYSMNPYDPRPDPRHGTDDGRPVLATGGSSSGVGTAASFWAASVGTETSGSIQFPALCNMLVGIKPTVGRISRYGIVPIVAEQDTAGPMARTVADAALLLGAMEGDQVDEHDSTTGICTPPANCDYTIFLDKHALIGARIGIPRAYYYEAIVSSNETLSRGGVSLDEKKLMEDAITALISAGATVVDPVAIPSIVDADESRNLLHFRTCAGTHTHRNDDSCSIVMKYGMKRDFNRWLQSLGDKAPVASLTELREYNVTHSRTANTMHFGQAVLDACDEMDIDVDRWRFEKDREKDLFLTREHGIDAALESHNLDALLFPGASGAALGAKAGYPSVTVPFGFIPNSLDPPAPPGFDPRPRPFGVTFTGTSCSDGRLIAIAYAFEQVTQSRVPPQLPND